MKSYIYARVSTEDQSFDQQMQDIKAYFASHGKSLEEIEEIVEEHISGGKAYEDRKFKELFNKCNPGDFIYAASTDRIGRNFMDMMKLMDEAKKRGVTIVACKQNISLSDDNPMAKIIFAIVSIMDEDERNRIKHRTANKKAWQKQQIKERGYFIIENGENKGQKCNYVGMPKKEFMTIAQAAAFEGVISKAAEQRHDKRLQWLEESKGFKWVMVQLAKGKPRNIIIEEFNELHETDPETFSTRRGGKLSKGTLSHWEKMMSSGV